MNATLLWLVQSDAILMETMHERYGGFLKSVRTMIGVLPNAFRYMEI
jgi:hypothetical protein